MRWGPPQEHHLLICSLTSSAHSDLSVYSHVVAYKQYYKFFSVRPNVMHTSPVYEGSKVWLTLGEPCLIGTVTAL